MLNSAVCTYSYTYLSQGGGRLGMILSVATESLVYNVHTVNQWTELSIVIGRVYFRPLKKGVVLPLAIVKRGRATP